MVVPAVKLTQALAIDRTYCKMAIFIFLHLFTNEKDRQPILVSSRGR
jgi:hypothetical protein